MSSHTNTARFNTRLTDEYDFASLPYLKLSSKTIKSVPYINVCDSDLFITPNNLNFNYYTPQEFCNNANIQECLLPSNYLSTLHSNIRSLGANRDQLTSMVSELSHQFSVIGLSETKHRFDRASLLNTEIPGYTFVSQPSMSNAGGVGFFIQNKLKFIKRDEISITTNGFEALWIELIDKSKRNFLCAVIYRHLHGNISIFMDYLNSTIDKVHRERKHCVIMGDFNIDLLV